MKKTICTVVLSILILLVGGCPNPGTSPDEASSKSVGGSLTITLPDIPLQPEKQPDRTVLAFYDVSGSGPGNAVFMRTGITNTSVTIDSLAPGDWGVIVNGNNLNGGQVEAANLLVTVVDGATVSHDVVVTHVVGEGTLDVFLEWPGDRGITSAAVALTPEGGVPLPITMQPVAPTKDGLSVSATALVPAGYYTLSRIFSDGTGGVDAVRITSGATTSFALSVISGMDVRITPDISKVIRITFDGHRPTIGKGTRMTLTARPVTSKQFNSFSYAWYLDGVLAPDETSDTIVVSGDSGISGDPGSLRAGLHRLTVVISSSGVLCSDDVDFKIP